MTEIRALACVLALMTAFNPQPVCAQTAMGTAQMQGNVRDSAGKPLVNATVLLQRATPKQTLAASTQTAHTDSQGAYRFATLLAGTYTVGAETNGYYAATVEPVSIESNETKTIDIVLKPKTSPEVPESAAQSGRPSANAKAPEFSDEPQFTVAGVTAGTNLGGHGSDTAMRTTEALAKATVSLSQDHREGSGEPSTASEASLRGALVRNPNDAALHHQLGEVEETLGKPLEAVREYQRAAEIDASEANLYDWGTELLMHRAPVPATEVLTKGNRLYPKSARMLIALGVAWYARGNCDQAAQYLGNASDLDPGNPNPYLFLGKMQLAQTVPIEGSVERLARFAQLEPQNALANYYYAVALIKQSRQESASATDAGQDAERSAREEALLQKAVHLDGKFGAAYLQLGILYAQRADFGRAISAYREAVEVSVGVSSGRVGSEIVNPQSVTPGIDETLEEAHYRLAQAYTRTGDKVKAQEELQLHDQLAKKTKEDTERKRREIQGFVVSLRGKESER